MPLTNLLQAALLTLALATSAAAQSPRRHLHVSLYPYIPAREEAALTLKQDFERQHPDILLDVTFNDKYYSLKPNDLGLVYENADIHEIDSALLDTFLSHRSIAPLGLDDLAASFDPQARPAGERHGTLIAAPHWMCADYLFYRADEPKLNDAPTFAEIARSLAPAHGLLMDLAGEETLAEILLDRELGEYANQTEAFAHLANGPTANDLARVEQFLALEPPGFGRDEDYDSRGVFYARQFARRTAGAYVGYSETASSVLEETAQSCRHEDHCVTANDIRVTRFPFADHGRPPGIWVDVYAIDATVHGQALSDARAFIRYAVSLPAYRRILIPTEGAPPRYLLPATSEAYTDPAILHAAPLYSRFHSLIQGGATIQGNALGGPLRETARRLDKALPATH